MIVVPSLYRFWEIVCMLKSSQNCQKSKVHQFGKMGKIRVWESLFHPNVKFLSPSNCQIAIFCHSIDLIFHVKSIDTYLESQKLPLQAHNSNFGHNSALDNVTNNLKSNFTVSKIMKMTVFSSNCIAINFT